MFSSVGDFKIALAHLFFIFLSRFLSVISQNDFLKTKDSSISVKNCDNPRNNMCILKLSMRSMIWHRLDIECSYLQLVVLLYDIRAIWCIFIT